MRIESRGTTGMSTLRTDAAAAHVGCSNESRAALDRIVRIMSFERRFDAKEKAGTSHSRLGVGS